MYLTPAAISFLTQFIISLCISAFLLYRLWKFRSNRHLQLLNSFFILATAFLGLLFLDASLPPYPRLFAVYAQNTVLALALTFLIQFAYRFPQKYPSHKLEMKIALWVSMGYFLWEGIYMLFRYVALLNTNTVNYRPPILTYANVLVLLWVPITFIRQSLSEDTRPENWLYKLWKPKGKDAQGTRNFALLFIILFILGIIDLLRIFHLPHTVYNAAMSLGILATLWLFISNYLNFLPGGSSIVIKVSVLALTLFLAILGSASWFIAPTYIATFEPNLYDRQTIRFTPNASGKYDVAEVDFNFETALGKRIDLGISEDARYQKVAFRFPFYGHVFTDIYIANAGAITLGEPYWHPNMQLAFAHTPIIFPLAIDLNPTPSNDTGGVYVHADTGRLIITWNNLPALHQPNSFFTFQAILYPSGIIEFSYNDLPSLTFDSDATPSATPWVRGILQGQGESIHTTESHLPNIYPSGQGAIIENYQLAFRRYLHDFMLPMTKTILVGSLLLTLIFPIFLKNVIISPLLGLSETVHQLEYDKKIPKTPSQSTDEIEHLHSVINNLAHHFQEGENREVNKPVFLLELQKKISKRQYEVLEKIVAGYTYKEIGQDLYISETTVKYHVKQIFTTLNIKNKRDLLRYIEKQKKV